MDSSKAQEELTKIGIGSMVEIWGGFSGLPGNTNRIEKLLSFDTTSVTVERPTSRDFKGRPESEVLYYSAITSIKKPETGEGQIVSEGIDFILSLDR